MARLKRVGGGEESGACVGQRHVDTARCGKIISLAHFNLVFNVFPNTLIAPLQMVEVLYQFKEDCNPPPGCIHFTFEQI